MNCKACKDIGSTYLHRGNWLGTTMPYGQTKYTYKGKVVRVSRYGNLYVSATPTTAFQFVGHICGRPTKKGGVCMRWSNQPCRTHSKCVDVDGNVMYLREPCK